MNWRKNFKTCRSKNTQETCTFITAVMIVFIFFLAASHVAYSVADKCKYNTFKLTQLKIAISYV